MGLMSSLKRLKLKKIKPGIILKKVIHAAATVGIPGAKTADKLADRIGQRVDSVNKVIAKASEVIKRESKDAGISIAESTDRTIARGIAGADAGLAIHTNSQGLMVGAIAILVVLLLMKGK